MIINQINWNPNPELVNIFGFSIRYYGLFFVTGLILSLFLLQKIFKWENIPEKNLEKLTIYGIIGILAGARLGHCLFYEPSYYLAHPLEMILPVSFPEDGGIKFVGYLGLASHGGALGLFLALLLYTRKTGSSLLYTLDLIAVVAALGSSFIRLGNLMNSEIIGKPTDLPWAFVFERVDSVPRHPAQLYEALAYFLIFAFMFTLYKRKREKLQNGFFFGLVLVLIFTARILIEFVKENQVGFEDSMTFNMGQWLSLPYVVTGILFMIYGWIKTRRLDGMPDGGMTLKT